MMRLRSVAIWTGMAALALAALTVIVACIGLLTHHYESTQREQAERTINNRFSCFDRGREDFFVTCKGLTDEGHPIVGKVCPQYSGPEAMLLQYDQEVILRQGYRCVKMNDGRLIDLPATRT